jgi:predicted membrane-bound spermidine synthase
MYSACFLAFSTGFLSLSLEILWVRLFAFANHSMPQAFAFVLVFYLVGIACGAHVGKWFCRKSFNLWAVCGWSLVLSSICDLAGPWIYASTALTSAQLWVGGFVIFLTALLKAIAFPIAHHLGTPTFAVKIGRNVSRVYVSNIFGATLGPFFTGMILLALLTTQQSFIVCAALSFLVAMYCLVRQFPVKVLSACTAVAILFFGYMLTLNGHRLITDIASPVYGKVMNVFENQYGIITVYPGGRDGDIVLGGNVYDGRTNLSPVINSNRINRVIILSALVEKPSRVLMIGLSVGSWLKLVTSFPGVEDIDVVEINPGYLDLIRYYPEQASALLDPRVHLHIGDGRRWLKEHPDNKYDMIVMNTTYHWRAYITNLLSQEFLRILKRHMNQNAILEYNTTGSPDALKTADSVFKNAYMYENFVVAGDFDWREKLHSSDAVARLAALQLDGKALFPPRNRSLIVEFLSLKVTPLSDVESIYNSMGRKLEIITDRNLITEFKYGKTL